MLKGCYLKYMVEMKCFFVHKNGNLPWGFNKEGKATVAFR